MEDFKDKVVVVTGGAQGIGRCIFEEFRKAGAQVCVIDKAAIKREPTSSLDWPSGSRLGEAKQEGDHFVGDIADKQILEQFAQEIIAKHGHVDYLINNALPLMKGIDECSYEEFQSLRHYILPLYIQTIVRIVVMFEMLVITHNNFVTLV